MKLYVGTYGKYNDGNLAGAWLDLDDFSSKEEFIEACRELHSNEEDAELMFQDCECENSLEEKFYCESFISEDYWNYKELIEETGLDAEAVADFISFNGYEIIEGIKKASDKYYGTFDSEEDFAESIVDEFGYLNNLPGWISCHIDWKGIVRDLSFDYCFCKTKDYKVAVFFNN